MLSCLVRYLQQVYREAIEIKAKAIAFEKVNVAAVVFRSYLMSVKGESTLVSFVTPIDHLGAIELPDHFPESGIFVLDTKVLFSSLLGTGPGNGRSLESTCLLLGIPTEFLHNAGNDAHVGQLSPFLTEVLTGMNGSTRCSLSSR